MIRRLLARTLPGRRVPAVIAGYVAIIVMALGAIGLVAAVASCALTLEASYDGRAVLALQTIVLLVMGAGLLRFGVTIMRTDDE